jgi:hypothetical protein
MGKLLQIVVMLSRWSSKLFGQKVSIFSALFMVMGNSE